MFLPRRNLRHSKKYGKQKERRTKVNGPPFIIVCKRRTVLQMRDSSVLPFPAPQSWLVSLLVFVAMITFGILGNRLFQILISCSRRNLCPVPTGCESMMNRSLVQGISDNCCEQHIYWNSHFSKIYRKIIISHAKPEVTRAQLCCAGNGRTELSHICQKKLVFFLRICYNRSMTVNMPNYVLQ